jgi:hypothetical protein
VKAAAARVMSKAAVEQAEKAEAEAEAEAEAVH